MWNLKRNIQMTYLWNRKRQTWKNDPELPGEDCGQRIIRKFGMDVYSLWYLKWITGKHFLCSTWSSAQCYKAGWVEGKLGENEYTCMQAWSPSLPIWDYYSIVNHLSPIWNKKLLKNGLKIFKIRWKLLTHILRKLNKDYRHMKKSILRVLIPHVRSLEVTTPSSQQVKAKQTKKIN